MYRIILITKVRSVPLEYRFISRRKATEHIEILKKQDKKKGLEGRTYEVEYVLI